MDRRRNDGRWAAPLRDVFPWWYLIGAALSVVVLLVLDPGGNTAILVLWGPAIGATIRERELDARSRLDRGLPIDRASLVAPGWLDPVMTLVYASGAVGLGLLLGAFFGDASAALGWAGAGLLLACAAFIVVLLSALRARRGGPRR